MTGKKTIKSQNVRERPNIYFCVEDGNSPYKSVKGKGASTIFEDLQTVIAISEKMTMKYLGTLENPCILIDIVLGGIHSTICRLQ